MRASFHGALEGPEQVLVPDVHFDRVTWSLETRRLHHHGSQFFSRNILCLVRASTQLWRSIGGGPGG
jgi:hypothetical protein